MVTKEQRRKWVEERDRKFHNLHQLLLSLDISEEQIKRNSNWEGRLRRTIFDIKKLLQTVDVTDLPWSSVYNTMIGYFQNIGWDYNHNTKIKNYRYVKPYKIKENIVNMAAFVYHWSPKSSETYSSRFGNERLKLREEVDPPDDLPTFFIQELDNFHETNIVRVLSSNYPRKPYVSLRQGLGRQERAGRHWGQRKLLMNEIELLILHAHEDYTMVYAGAAPCTHLSIVEDMFNVLRMKYILIDPAPFHVRNSQNISIRTGSKGLFSNETAQEFIPIHDKLLFVSDIRREHDSELQILQDMEDQMQWHLIMQPRASMFKFRLPWFSGLTPYVNGKVYIQPYAQMHSTEMRLIATSTDICNWNNTIYEEQCFYFNTVTRLLPHPHGVKGAGLDESYDCAAEVEISRLYFQRFDREWLNRTIEERNELIASLSVFISERLGGQRGRDFLSRAESEEGVTSRASSNLAINFIKSLVSDNSLGTLDNTKITSKVNEEQQVSDDSLIILNNNNNNNNNNKRRKYDDLETQENIESTQNIRNVKARSTVEEENIPSQTNFINSSTPVNDDNDNIIIDNIDNTNNTNDTRKSEVLETQENIELNQEVSHEIKQPQEDNIESNQMSSFVLSEEVTSFASSTSQTNFINSSTPE